jgi:hypothetical protein
MVPGGKAIQVSHVDESLAYLLILHCMHTSVATNFKFLAILFVGFIGFTGIVLEDGYICLKIMHA